jgi:hypothetical protein
MSARRSRKLEDLAAECSIEIEFLELAVHEGAVSEEELRAEEHAAAARARLRRLRRLTASLDLDVYAGSIIVDLLERLESAQAELERRRGREA